ncbi:hypothetical protein KIN20_029242 [Parelaphostrongylus tenuis]|uniref:Uncharacterized protein n=1 Tax=Parelaphostrongylus tenuis TaxID=148309 RepID=A0AAD5WFG2_PARTN|nr:hypothetical protein KIN20_029242 [Parelaphostrongylus tenuis]
MNHPQQMAKNMGAQTKADDEVAEVGKDTGNVRETRKTIISRDPCVQPSAKAHKPDFLISMRMSIALNATRFYKQLCTNMAAVVELLTRSVRQLIDRVTRFARGALLSLLS